MSSSRTRELSSGVRLPGPGQDATPFMLRCCVKRPPFRSLQDFEGPYVRQDEFKIYVWRSATLRDVAALLHIRDPRLSSPLALHTFRLVFFEHGQYRARQVGSGVTRLSSAALTAAVDDVLDGIDGKADAGSHTNGQDADMADPGSSSTTGAISAAYEQTVKRLQPIYPRDAEEASARQTLDDIGVTDGHILDVVIREPRPQQAESSTSPFAARRGGAAGRGRGPLPSDRAIEPSAAIPPALHPWSRHSDRHPPRHPDEGRRRESGDNTRSYNGDRDRDRSQSPQ